MKRALDFAISACFLILLSPVLLILMLGVFLQDFQSPLYGGVRVGMGGKPFRMLKLRSMKKGADQNKVDSTSAADSRITPLGHYVRRFKLDEFLQLVNVLAGDMSLVGPRPNVPREVAIYTEVERALVQVRPGVTDMASIVFYDEGQILSATQDPDLAYNQLIRPWKSRLALFHIRNQSFLIDFAVLGLTAVAIFSRPRALQSLSSLLRKLKADDDLIDIALRNHPLVPTPPPGATQVVLSRNAPPT